MNDSDLRAAYLFVALACIGCGSNEATDFFSPARGGTNGGGAAGAAQPAGSGGAQQAGAGGMPPGGTGSAGSSGAGSGGTIAGGGGSSGAGTANGGTSGTGTVAFSCGSLTCIEGRQYCVRTPPPAFGGPEELMCLPFPDRCNMLDCSCFCGPPQLSPCGPESTCSCSGDAGRITVVCGGM